MMERTAIGVGLWLGLSLLGCKVPSTLERVDNLLEAGGPHVYFLEVDDDGSISNETAWREVVRSIREILQPLPEGSLVENELLVLCYGWNNESDDAAEIYLDAIEAFVSREQRTLDAPHQTVIVCVQWDSRFSVVQDALDSLVPIGGIGVVGYPVDLVLFPLSFWAMASRAEAIGRWTLPRVLEDLYRPSKNSEPVAADLLLVGHSFGGRAVARCLKFLKTFPATDWASSLAGVLLLQPAVHEASLPDGPLGAPVVVTHSTHDKANKLLYPAANLAFNTLLLGFALDDRDYERSPLTPRGTEDVLVGATIGTSWPLFLSPLLTPTLTFGNSTVLDGAGFGYGISSLFSWSRSVWQPQTFGSMLAATASEIPIFGGFLQAIVRRGSGDGSWGGRAAGLFAGGEYLHSAGSAPLTSWSGPREQVVLGYEDLVRSDYALTSKLYRVDVSSVAGESFFGYCMNACLAPLVTWLDPIGSHTDTSNPAVFRLIEALISKRSACATR